MKKYIAENGKLEIIEVEKPSGELIEVKAIGVNRADVFHLQRRYPVFGLEFAGLLNGKRVAGIVDGGAYAEFIEADKAVYFEIPDSISFEQAAAITEALFTAYYNLTELCEVKYGEEVLIHGGASGVGVVAIQLAKMLGANVAATSNKVDKLALIGMLGATPIDYSSGDFGEKRYDVILDIVGGSYFNANLKALKKNGGLAIISFIGGVKADANLAPLLTKDLTVKGSTIRSLSKDKKQDLAEKILPYFEQIKPIIDKEFAFDKLDEALKYVEGYENLGKVVVSI